jgi:hypothetical protein
MVKMFDSAGGLIARLPSDLDLGFKKLEKIPMAHREELPVVHHKVRHDYLH